MLMISFATIVAVSSAALLPSKTYLPQNEVSRPSNSYLTPIDLSAYYTAHQHSGQTFGASNILTISGSGGSGYENRRPQESIEKIAAVLKLDQDMNEHGFHYSYETSNGIRAEQSGNAAQTQGSFSYTGDDGITYNIVYTAGEGGYRPQGDHIPVPPPTPQAILEALAQNAKDEAAGIFDDGKYRPDGSGKRPAEPSQAFASINHQETFSGNTGYRY